SGPSAGARARHRRGGVGNGDGLRAPGRGGSNAGVLNDAGGQLQARTAEAGAGQARRATQGRGRVASLNAGPPARANEDTPIELDRRVLFLSTAMSFAGRGGQGSARLSLFHIGARFRKRGSGYRQM